MTQLRACLECGRPTTGNRCNRHPRPKHYASTHWQTIRTARLDHDGNRCTYRYPGCTIVATTVHLAPEANGNHLLATIDNTRSACRTCHGIEDAPRANGYEATSTRKGGRVRTAGSVGADAYPAKFSRAAGSL